MNNPIFFLRNNIIFQDIISMVSGKTLASGLYLIASLFLMYKLPVKEYGQYVYYYSIIAIIPFFLDLGTNNAFVAMGSKELNTSVGKYEILKSNFVFVKLLFVFLSIVAGFFLYLSDIISIFSAFLFLIGIAVAVQDIFFTLLSVKKQFKFLACLMPLRNAMALFIIISAYIFSEMNYIVAIFSLGGASIISLCVYIILVKQIKIKIIFISKAVVWSFFQYSGWLILYAFSITIMMRIDVFVLSYYSEHNFISADELGHFSAAFTFAFILPLITTSVVRVALPDVAKFIYKDEVNKYRSIINKYIIHVLILISLMILFISSIMIIFQFSKYSDSTIVYIVISIATVFTFYSNLLLNVFFAAKKTKIIAFIGGGQLLVSIISDFILIYYFGALGASFSMLIVRMIGCFFIIFYFNRSLINEFKDRL